jgi:Type IV secretion system pilin
MTGKFLTDTSDIFGKVEPPPGPIGLNSGTAEDGFARLFVTGIKLIFIVGGISLLVYLLWGSYLWIIAGGDPDKVKKAQAQMRNAFLGVFALVVSLALFRSVTGDVLGIFDFTGLGIEFTLPQF